MKEVWGKEVKNIDLDLSGEIIKNLKIKRDR